MKIAILISTAIFISLNLNAAISRKSKNQVSTTLREDPQIFDDNR